MATTIKKLSSLPILSLLLLIIFLLFSAAPKTATAISTSSVDILLTLLRHRGHTLLANAISTSDLLFDILRLPSLTILAPPNPSLYAPYLTQTRPVYLSNLRLHVVPYLLSLSLPASPTPQPTLIRTLLPSRNLHLTVNSSSLLVNGVEIILPPLYYSTSLAVYRLRRSMSFADLYRPLVPYPRNGRLPPVHRTTALPLFQRRNLTVFSAVNWTITPLVPLNRTVFPVVNWTVAPLVPFNRTVFPPVNRTVTPLVPPNQTVCAPVNRTFTPNLTPPSRTVPAPAPVNNPKFTLFSRTVSAPAPVNNPAFTLFRRTVPAPAPVNDMTVVLFNRTVPAPAPDDNMTVALFNRTVPAPAPVDNLTVLPHPENLSVACPPELAFDFGLFAPPAPTPTPASAPETKNSPAPYMEEVKCVPLDAEDVRCRLLDVGHIDGDDYDMLRFLTDHDL
ncbi:hypothetical protein Tsubulata_026511 [Turnera subulata]|uniref:FAS1 domain-containing protein n=1 Tax=Turnera subulata TaxID=218843 RepID=A0A9Q0JGL2_9ROSI|nr:hypothetical protein Tsubulata_026511 [Turnera subulata]